MRLGILLSALFAAAVSWASPAVAESWYAQRITSGDAPLRVDQMWSDGPKLRSESVIAGRPITTIVNGRSYWIVDRLSGKGIAIERSPAAVAADARVERPFGNESAQLQRVGAERVSTERLGGKECELYRVTDGAGRREICVTPDAARLPLQMIFWARATGQEVTVRYLDWLRAVELPEPFFRPSSDLVIEEISYRDYVERASREMVGPAPVFFADLLHGPR